VWYLTLLCNSRGVYNDGSQLFVHPYMARGRYNHISVRDMKMACYLLC